MQRPVRILVVDDHVLFREGLVGLLKSQADFTVVGEAGSVAEAVPTALELMPDIILMDYSLPDGSGADAAKSILRSKPEIRIVFLTVHESDDFLIDAVSSGAKGYLLKNVSVSKLLEALRGLERGEAPISRKMTSRILEELRRRERRDPQVDAVFNQLTSRELDVLKEIISGASNYEISQRLYISINTVKNHIHNMLEKTNLRNRRELSHFARQHGLTKPTDTNQGDTF